MIDAKSIAQIAEKFGPNFPNNDEGVSFVRKWFEDHGYDPLAISGSEETSQKQQPFSQDMAKELLANCVDGGMNVTSFGDAVDFLSRFIDGDDLGQDDSFKLRCWYWAFDPIQRQQRFAMDRARRQEIRPLDYSIIGTRYDPRSRTSQTSASDSFAKQFPEAARITDTTWGKQ